MGEFRKGLWEFYNSGTNSCGTQGPTYGLGFKLINLKGTKQAQNKQNKIGNH